MSWGTEPKLCSSHSPFFAEKNCFKDTLGPLWAFQTEACELRPTTRFSWFWLKLVSFIFWVDSCLACLSLLIPNVSFDYATILEYNCYCLCCDGVSLKKEEWWFSLSLSFSSWDLMTWRRWKILSTWEQSIDFNLNYKLRNIKKVSFWQKVKIMSIFESKRYQ